MALATAALYTARPSIDLDGAASPELTDRVLSVVASETTEGMARAEIVLGNWDGTSGDHGYVFSARDVVDFGSPVALHLGDGDRAGTVFNGLVTGIEAHFPEARPPELVLLAEDRLQDLRMTRRTRSFEDVSDEDVIREVVSGHGLRASLDIDGPTHRHVAQVNQSDLAFVRDRARLVDADVWIDGDTVHVVGRSARDREELTLTYHRDLHELSVLADLANQRTAYVVSGWDVAAKEAIVAESGTAAVQSELDGETAGADLLERVFGGRTETIVHTTPVTSAEAQARADMAMRTSARRFLTAHGRAEGDARLRVGARVRFEALGPGFTGRYTLVEVEHAFDDRFGYRTRFRAERAGIGAGT